MTSTDDPDRDRRPTSRQTPQSARRKLQTRVTPTWSRPARAEYSRFVRVPAAASLNAIAKKAAGATIEYLQAHHTALQKFPGATTYVIDLSFVSDREIQELNASYRGKNKPTDVLSFAQTEGEAFPGAESWSDEGGKVLLGDLVIAVATAHRQALELKHSLEHEVAFLTVHGTLHLCGFDHDTSSRRRTMWKLQDTVTQSLFNSSSCSSR